MTRLVSTTNKVQNKILNFTNKCQSFFRGSFISLSSITVLSCGQDTESTQALDVAYDTNIDFDNSDQIPLFPFFPTDYEPPIDTSPKAAGIEMLFNLHLPEYLDPYWVNALVMDQSNLHIEPVINKYGRVVNFSFPDVQPDYDHFGLVGWKAATQEMQAAARLIFSQVEQVINVSFEEIDTPIGYNTISIARSEQSSTAGLSYFPNFAYEIGMDVFISERFDNPKYIGGNNTNYDYEVILHEIGHALGLKHPFESDGANQVILTDFELKPNITAMSYDKNEDFHDGVFRPLDWLALTKIYGVNEDFNSQDNTYVFSDETALFIVDGAGNDTIDASQQNHDVLIDLRQGSHSFSNNKSDFISSPNQLTVSHGSIIENVKTGKGNDTIIGNEQVNLITSGDGNDIIYAGEGADVIYLAAGSNEIDLSEEVQSVDTIFMPKYLDQASKNTVYLFKQGKTGDIINLSEFNFDLLELLPVVTILNVPECTISNGVCRLFGDELESAFKLKTALLSDEEFGSMELIENSQAIVITSISQAEGDSQNLFHASDINGTLNVTKLAIFDGGTMDLDTWHSDNFLI
jgi:hypothetical protein